MHIRNRQDQHKRTDKRIDIFKLLTENLIHLINKSIHGLNFLLLLTGGQSPWQIFMYIYMHIINLLTNLNSKNHKFKRFPSHKLNELSTYMIGAYKAGLFATSGSKKGGMMATNIMKCMNFPIVISAHHILHFSNSATSHTKVSSLNFPDIISNNLPKFKSNSTGDISESKLSLTLRTDPTCPWRSCEVLLSAQ